MRLRHDLKIIRILCELPGGLKRAYSEDMRACKAVHETAHLETLL